MYLKKNIPQLRERIAIGSRESRALGKLESRLANNEFLRSSWFTRWTNDAKTEIEIGFFARVRQWIFDKEKYQAFSVVRQLVRNPSANRDFLNEEIVSATTVNFGKFFDEVESNPLTKKQREACASDEDATLVIAGAGTGKTSTIVAKIGLLLLTKQCTQDQILAISFTTKSANELAERVKENLKVDLRVSTFHKLGLDTIAQLDGGKPNLAPFAGDPEEKAKVIDSVVSSLRKDPSFLKDLLNFCVFESVEPKQTWDFKTLSEYNNWLRSNKIISLDGIPKKSFQECVIANWLILNGIKFEYEKPYEHSTKTVEHRQYCPDFFLSDLGVYIEHFGVDELGKTAPYINSFQYAEGMRWKRETHKKYATSLIETFSWEHEKGVLLTGLESKLRTIGCNFKPLDLNDALDMLNKGGMVSQFSKLISTFLTLYKGNGNRLSEHVRIRTIFGERREKLFLSIFERIFAAYERRNRQHSEIDFEDMISLSSLCVKSHPEYAPYRYILIDEFQDISPGRADLVKSLLANASDCALFAVGDDWQSIYRFAGADIGSMTKFSEIFGSTRQVALDTTFRFDDQSVTASSAFVLKNKAQIRKSLTTIRKSTSPSLVLYKRAPNEPPLDWSLNEISKIASAGASVLILERYKFHLPQDSEWSRLVKKFQNLKLNKMSIHAAKGLEADYVVMGLRGGVWGFPSQVIDDPLFEMVLTAPDDHPHAEERRLFYVALTRARYKTFLVCETGQDQSDFASELLEGNEFPKEVFGLDTKKLTCRKCGSGSLRLRDGSNGKFYGCSNYPLCGNTEQTCLQCGDGLMTLENNRKYSCHMCGHEQSTCPRCQTGMLIAKKGKNGTFYGCTNYWDPEVNCSHTENP
jgi:DNA helicase IV